MSYNAVYQNIGLKDYKEVWDYQEKIFKTLVEKKVHSLADGGSGENSDTGYVIFVEHPHVYTLGRNGSENNLLADYVQLRARDAKFYRTDRGGDITYHGPGQIVVYPILDLEKLKMSLKDYIYNLEETIIRSVSVFGLAGTRLKGATGVWLDAETASKARKICAIGVKASRYVTMHGFAFNVNTDLTYFNYINPCGFVDKGVTSLEKELGVKQDIGKVSLIVKRNLKEIFGLNWINQDGKEMGD